jgi:hypothetical protein
MAVATSPERTVVSAPRASVNVVDATNHNRDMPQFIVEIRLHGVAGPEMARVARVLSSANARLGHVARAVTASVGCDDGRLVFQSKPQTPKPFAT